MSTLLSGLLPFLRTISARCVIVLALSTVTVIGALALALCAIHQIAPTTEVMSTLKDVILMAVTALTTFLVPRGEEEAKPPPQVSPPPNNQPHHQLINDTD